MKKNSSKKLKENPIMGEQNKVRNINISDGDNNEIKTFIIIIIVIAILTGIIYGITELLKKEEKNENLVTSGVINYEKVSVGTILNRPYEEYYVLIYDGDSKDAVLYSTLLTKYMQKSNSKDYIKAYYCDLSNSLNNKYYNVNNDGKSNKNANKIEDFDFGDLTLIKIKNGKIESYIEEYKTIKEILVK